MWRTLSEGVEIERAMEVVDSEAERLFTRDPAIQSVGVGRHGTKFGIAVVRGVDEVIPLASVGGVGRRLQEIAGVPVQVTTVRRGRRVEPLVRIRVRTGGRNSGSSRIAERRTTSPLFCGVEIQNFTHDERRKLLADDQMEVGTLGCFVQKDGMTALLSTNHLLAGSNLASAGDRIVHAGTTSWGKKSQWVADLAGSVSLTPTLSETPSEAIKWNRVDAAYAVLRPDIARNTGYHPEAKRPAPTHIGDAKLGERVFKIGRTTGFRSGVVEGINSRVQALHYTGLGWCWFERAIKVSSTGGKAFARKGDSGALVFNDRGGAIGLVFAAGPQFTYVCPLRAVLTGLDCLLLTEDGPVGPE